MFIKPDAVRKKAVGKIIAKVEDAGFAIRAMRMVHLTPEQAREFYREHAEKGFFADLIAFVTGGPVVALLLERENAVETLRELIGSTDSRKAAPGTIRAEFGTDNQQNAVHASDSPASAQREMAFFFSHLDTVASDAD